MAPSDHDIELMHRALALAKKGWGETNPNPMVGAVIEKDGRIIGEGFHRRAGEAHAEVNAVNDAVSKGFDVAGATCYVTLEPCSSYGRTPPCTEALISNKIKKVVIGTTDPNPKHAGRGIEKLNCAGIETVCPVLEDECRELNRFFFRWITTGKPFVLLKLAVTLDGKIACANGDSKWVTGAEARTRVQYLRKMADAIIIGGNTARIDRPRLTVREFEQLRPQPLRLVASKRMTEAELKQIFPDGNARIVNIANRDDGEKLLHSLGSNGKMFLLAEGGAELAAALLTNRLVDEVEFHIAPKILGGKNSISAVAGSDPVSMAAAIPLENIKTTRCGSDFIVSGKPIYSDKEE